MDRRTLYLILGIVVISAAIVGGFLLLGQPPLHGTVMDPPKAMEDFSLTGGSGPVSLASLQGKVVVLFFGYTNCPDECPITMGKLKSVVNDMGSQGDLVRVVMVTVDPERDDAATVSKYAQGFNPSFIGLTGSADQIAAVAKEFGIGYQKTEIKSPTVYGMEHTLAEFVFDKQGNLRAVWPYEITTGDALSDLKTLAAEK